MVWVFPLNILNESTSVCENIVALQYCAICAIH